MIPRNARLYLMYLIGLFAAPVIGDMLPNLP
jgi:hypothetical protein